MSGRDGGTGEGFVRRHNRCGIGDPDMCGHPDCPDLPATSDAEAVRGKELMCDHCGCTRWRCLTKFDGECCGHCEHPASDADPASTSASEVEGLAFVVCPDLEHTIHDGHDACEEMTARILASDWLRDREAAAETRGRAEALREEADELWGPSYTGGIQWGRQDYVAYLRARADSLAAPRGDGQVAR